MKPEMPITRAGRPREFDLNTALDAALLVFWRNGFEGASLSDLTAAMKINRPSLYAAFGSKEELFRRTMQRYIQRAEANMAACDAEPTSRGYIECILRTAADGATNCNNPAGCFLIQGAIACGASADALRLETAQRRMAAREMLRARFQRAVASGELPPNADPAALASFYAAVMHGMALQAASGVTRADLQQVVDVALRAWPGTGTPTRSKSKPPRRRRR